LSAKEAKNVKRANYGTSDQVVIARSEATRQSRNTLKIKYLDCFAALAMTSSGTWSEGPYHGVDVLLALLSFAFFAEKYFL